jgi:hypothetical protein
MPSSPAIVNDENGLGHPIPEEDQDPLLWPHFSQLIEDSGTASETGMVSDPIITLSHSPKVTTEKLDEIAPTVLVQTLACPVKGCEALTFDHKGLWR